MRDSSRIRRARLAIVIAAIGWLSGTLFGSRSVAAQEPAVGPSHAAIVEQLGLYDDPALDQLLQEVGERVAAASRYDDRSWSFWLIDDPAINLFSIPPGGIYLTRGLFLYLDTEAELAALLAHAVAHIGEGHVLLELDREELQRFGVGLPRLANSELADFLPLAISGLEPLTGGYRADDERRADELMVQTLERAEYDLTAPATVYEVIEDLEGVDPPGRVPGWWQTHTGPDKRSKRVTKEAATFPQARRSGEIGRERFLPYLEGIVFGSNLTRPYFDQMRFFDRQAGFRIDIPGRWSKAHFAGSILAVSPEGDAVIQVAPTEATDNVEALRAFFTDPQLEAKRSWRRSVNNLSAVWATFDVRRERRDLEGRIGFITVGDTVYRLLGYGLERLWLRHFTAVQNSFEGMRKTKAPTEGDGALDSARIELMEIDEEMSLSQLEEEYPSATERRNVRALNRLFEGRRTEAGGVFKRVVGGLDAVDEEDEDGDEGGPEDDQSGSDSDAADEPTGTRSEGAGEATGSTSNEETPE